MSWFSFTGTNPTIPSHYTNVGGTPPSCLGTDKICAVQATADDDGNPILSDTLKNEMIVALNNRTPSTNVLLKP